MSTPQQKTPHPALQREKALQAVIAGTRSQSDVAKEFGVSRQAVHVWVKEYKEGRVVSTQRGRPQTIALSLEQKIEIQSIVQNQTPHDLKLGGQYWNCAALKSLLFDKYRKKYPHGYCVGLIDEFGIPKDPALSHQTRTEEPKHLDDDKVIDSTNKNRGRPRKNSEDSCQKLTTAQWEYYKSKIREAQEILQESEEQKDSVHNLGSKQLVHGIRTGKHAKGKASRKSKGSKKREKRQVRKK